MHDVRSAACFTLAALALACGSAEPAREALGFDQDAPEELATPEQQTAPGFFDGTGAAPERVDPESCAVTRVTLRETRRPIDVVMVLDNSVSMANELGAVERNINQHFGDILEQSGADYRVIVISRHRTAERSQTDAARTAVCISAPLSSLEDCPAGSPGVNGRFFHYAIDIDSTDSLTRLLETYAAPDPLYRLTSVGWSEWLRADSRKVFLEFTDDDALLSARDFLERLTELAPEHFGDSPNRPTFAFHSVVGVAARASAAAYAPEEPIVSERCRVEERLAPSSGRTYQTLSRLTGGLRYPLCTLESYDQIFESVARDSVTRSGLGCRFPVPVAPAGQRLDLERIALEERGADARSTRLAKVDTRGDCAPDGYYVEAGNIELCPQLCEALGALPASTLDAVFDCTAYLEPR